MATRIAINGFGRIGRCVARILLSDTQSDIEIVHVNDLTSPEMLAHLLEFDSVHRRFSKPVSAVDGGLKVGDDFIPVTAERDPSKLPWKERDVDVVLECTGVFRTKEKSQMHLDAGANRVIISAPGGKDIDGTFCVGINSGDYDAAAHHVISNASCTTNCLAPVAKVLDETVGIVKGHMVTIHSYTNDQRILDLPHKKFRRCRAAGLSMIPTTTGAADAIALVIPSLKGKLSGGAIRVPTPNVSLVCLSAHVARDTTVAELNGAFEAAAKSGPLKGILGFETKPLVSNDYIGNPHSSIIDADQTQVVGGDLVEIQSWYDNEWGFSNRMVDLTRIIAKKG